jgi:polysaccharide export outer membrane protein
MSMTRIVIALFLIFNFSALPYVYAEGSTFSSTDREYVISPDDIIETTVYGEPDLSAVSRVSQDGTIIYPLLGNIMAAGLTVRELERNITELLAEDYLVSPQVSVFIKEYGKISILGAIRTPGAYQAKERLTLTQVIALAGGFTEDANITNVKIIRAGMRGSDTMVVDVSQILDKAMGDIEIKPKDTIMVEEYGRFSITGQVMKPGLYKLKKDLTVTEAIIIAGGFTPAAAQNGTKLIREKDGQKTVVNVPVVSIAKSGDNSKDIMLQPGDAIVVPESFF